MYFIFANHCKVSGSHMTCVSVCTACLHVPLWMTLDTNTDMQPVPQTLKQICLRSTKGWGQLLLWLVLFGSWFEWNE